MSQTSVKVFLGSEELLPMGVMEVRWSRGTTDFRARGRMTGREVAVIFAFTGVEAFIANAGTRTTKPNFWPPTRSPSSFLSLHP